MSFAKTLIAFAAGSLLALPAFAQNNDVGKDKGGAGDKKGALMMDKGGADKKGMAMMDKGGDKAGDKKGALMKDKGGADKKGALMMDKGGDKGGKKGMMDSQQMEAVKQGTGAQR